MPLLVKQGTFNKPSNTTGQQAVAGIGFQPKALILWGTQHDAVGFAAQARTSFGFTDGTRQFATSGFTRNIFGTITGRSTGSAVYVIANLALGAALVQGEIVSFDADGFTIDWTTNGSAFTSIIHYIALAGDDLEAFVGNFQGPFAPGDQAIAGLGFEPDALLVAHNDVAALDTTVIDLGGIGLGVATADDQAVMQHRSSTAGQVRRGQGADYLILNAIGFGAPNSSRRASLASMDNDGFTLTWDVQGFVLPFHGYLALGGVAAAVGLETQPTSTGEKATTGLGLTPSALMLFGFNRVANAIPAQPFSPFVDHCRFSVGGSDGATEGGMGYYHTRGSTASRDLQFTDKIIEFADVDVPAATEAEADLKSFDSDGYTLDWTKADAVAREFVYLALGVAPPQPIGPILEVLAQCIRLGLIIHPATWASALAASGFLPLGWVWPDPSGWVESGEDCETWNQPAASPAGSGYTKEEGGGNLWDMP